MGWDISLGCFTNLERLSRQYPQVSLASYRLKEISALLEERDLNASDDPQGAPLIINAQFIPSLKIEAGPDVLALDKQGHLCFLRAESLAVQDLQHFLNEDIKELQKKFKTEVLENGFYMGSLADVIEYNAALISQDARLYLRNNNYVSPGPDIFIHKTAKIDQYVSLNSEQGPIVIDENTHIRPFSILDGPVYIGRNSLLDSAMIRSGTSIRDHCRIGGEVESSIIESYTNKHHEGFLGHSYLGSWVNIGALATTSDLKNNYGKIRLQIGKKTINTGSIKLGSIIADYSKVGIGMMLNTGTVISPGANIFQDKELYGKFMRPFQWGNQGIYELPRFIKDLKTVMSRRAVQPGDALLFFLERYYKKTVKIKKKASS